MSFKIVHLIPTQSTSSSHSANVLLFLTYHFRTNNIDSTPGIENGEDARPSCSKHVCSDEERGETALFAG